LFRSTRPEDDGAAGFTLIEALAALCVMGAGLAAVGSLASANLRATLHTEQHLAGVESARKVITGLPGRDALPFGRLNGALDAQAWRIESSRVEGASEAVTGWEPQNISLSVLSPMGATVQIDMIRLRRLPRK
jgi:general secretion pathway protein I